MPVDSVWKFFADDVKHGKLPNLVNTQDETIGTFRREIAQRRPSYQYFNVGNPFFDSVISSLDLHTTGRTYAVAYFAPGEETWAGFEFVLKPGFDSEIFLESPGSFNRMENIFNMEPLRIFVGVDGETHLDPDHLLSIRRGHGEYRWIDLSEGRVSDVRDFSGVRWNKIVADCYENARNEARKIFDEGLSAEIKLNISQIEEQIRLLEVRGGVDSGVGKDILTLQLLKDAVRRWHVELDGIGFLSLNVIDV